MASSKKSNSYLDKSEAKIDSYYGGQQKYIKVLRSLNDWQISGILDISLLTEEEQELYEQYQSEIDLSKRIFEFGVAARKNDFQRNSGHY